MKGPRKIDITSPTTINAMQDIFNKTWLYDNPGLGHDAKGLTHTSMQVKNIYHVTNPLILERYLSKVRKYKETAKQLPRGRFKGIGVVQDALAQNPILSKQLQGDDLDDFPCDPKINEMYLFHGTKAANVNGIIENGFDIERAQRILYGKAIYFAETAQKSDQYAGIIMDSAAAQL